jgi:hypothetical protein
MYNDKIEPIGSLNMKGLDKLYVCQNTLSFCPCPGWSSPNNNKQEKHGQEENSNMRNDREKTEESRNKKPERCFIWL